MARELINNELILLNRHFKSKEDIIKKIADQAEMIAKVSSKEKYLEAVFERESLISTSVGYGIAIPHGKSEAVNEDFLGFCRLDEPIKWDEEGEVDLVFLMGVSTKNGNDKHLRYLAMISRKLMNEDFRNSLRNAYSKEQIYNLLNNIMSSDF